MRIGSVVGLFFVVCFGMFRCVPVGVGEPSGELVVIDAGGKESLPTESLLVLEQTAEFSSMDGLGADGLTPHDTVQSESLGEEVPFSEGMTVEGNVPDNAEDATVEGNVSDAAEDATVEGNVPDASEPPAELIAEQQPACLRADGKDLCDDGNACNGVERCDLATGRCLAGKPMVCDDGDDCNGTETCDPKTGKCVAASAFVCPIAPSECNQTGGAGQPVAGRVVRFQPVGGFRLRDLDQWASSEQIVDQIAAHPSVAKVTLAALLQDLNRSGSKVSAVSGVSCLVRGYAWESGDNAVAYWYPQGLTGSASANSAGKVDGKSVLVASWYHKPEEDSSTTVNKGVRLSFVDSTNQAVWPYRHALLVEPMVSNGKPSYRPIPIHAGGLAWF